MSLPRDVDARMQREPARRAGMDRSSFILQRLLPRSAERFR
jgi:hypothetical protein